MSYIELIIEQRIAEAIARGELDPGPLKGRPLPDIDRQRPDGWWAEEFVKRERSRVTREAALDEQERWRRRFRRAGDEPAVRALVGEANAWVATVNRRVRESDAVEPFAGDAVVADWRTTRRRSPR